jgi:hypothetical protein
VIDYETVAKIHDCHDRQALTIAKIVPRHFLPHIWKVGPWHLNLKLQQVPRMPQRARFGERAFPTRSCRSRVTVARDVH